MRVLEAASGPGGKAGVALIDGVEVDTGPACSPSHVFDDLLRLAGTCLADQLLAPDPAFRYLWPDGTARTPSLEGESPPSGNRRRARESGGRYRT